MGTFPSAYDYGRPVPQTPTVIAPVGQAPQAPQQSLVAAQTTADAGQAIEKVGQKIDDYGLHLDTLQAQEAVNNLRRERQDLTYGADNGFMKVQGGDVLKPVDGQSLLQAYSAKFQAAQDRVAADLSPRARMLFNQRAMEEQDSYRKEIMAHALQQTEVHEKGVYNDTMTTLGVELARNIDNPQAADGIVAKMATATENYLARKGLPTEGAKAEAQSGAYATVISMQIQSGNDQAALAVFSRYGDKLTPADKLKLMPSIETIQRGQSAKEFARNPGAFTGSSPDFDARLAAGEGGSENGGFVFNKLGSGAYGPFQFMPATWSDIRAKNPGLNLPADITQASFEQHRAANEAFKAANAESLKADGYEPTPTNMYLAHRFGAKGAVAVLKANPDTPLDKILPPKWFEQNPDLRGRTAGEFIDGAQKRMAGVTGVFGSKPGAPGNVTDNRVGDVLATSVNDVTAGRPARTLDDAVNAAVTPAVRQTAGDVGQGIPNARQQMIQIEQERQRAREINYAQYSGYPKIYAANEAAINSLYEQRKAAVDLYKLQFWDAVQQHMLTGGRDADGRPNGKPATEMPPANLVSQLDYQQVEQLQKQVDANIRGAKPKTNWEVYTDLQRGLTHENANVREYYAKMHPMQFRGQLADDQYNHVLEMQAAVRKGDGKEVSEAVSRSQIIKTTLEQVLGPEPKPSDTTKRADYASKEAQFNRVLNYEVDAFEKEKGQKATAVEFQKIVDGVVKNAVSGDRKGWFGWGGQAQKPVFQLSLSDVPAADRESLATYLRSVGVVPTQEAILEAYRHKLVIDARKRTAVPYGRGNWQPGVDATPAMDSSQNGGSVQAATAPSSGPLPPAPMRISPLMSPSDYSGKRGDAGAPSNPGPSLWSRKPNERTAGVPLDWKFREQLNAMNEREMERRKPKDTQ